MSTALQKAIVGREVVRASGRCAYIVYPDGIGRSKLTQRDHREDTRHAGHGEELEYRAEARRPRWVAHVKAPFVVLRSL